MFIIDKYGHGFTCINYIAAGYNYNSFVRRSLISREAHTHGKSDND